MALARVFSVAALGESVLRRYPTAKVGNTADVKRDSTIINPS